MNARNTHPVCATCRDRIGVYEPVWAEQPDGTLIRTGMLEIDDRHGHASPLYHLGCLAAEQIRRRAA
jgi:hypothetical protein